MFVERNSIVVETNSSGSADVRLSGVSGLLSTIHYVKDDFADGVAFTITEAETGATLWAESGINASTVRSPRQVTHSPAGEASTAASGDIAVRGDIRIVIAEGGDTKSGRFIF